MSISTASRLSTTKLGHSAGDKLLIEVARRLQSSSPRSFRYRCPPRWRRVPLLLPDAADNQAIEALTRRIAAEIKRPYDINQQCVTVSASLGISTIEPDDDYEAFLHRADLAMYKAKRGQGHLTRGWKTERSEPAVVSSFPRSR